MFISEAAAQAGVNVQTIRYYERRGLLPPSARRPSGYRELPDEAVRVVRFIKRAQDLGFSLDEVAELLRLRRSKDRAKAQAVAGRRLKQIEQKLAEGNVAEAAKMQQQLDQIENLQEVLDNLADAKATRCPPDPPLSVSVGNARDFTVCGVNRDTSNQCAKLAMQLLSGSINFELQTPMS